MAIAPSDWFLQAMARWQKGDTDEARKWFDKAVAWTKEKNPKNLELRGFWKEAAELEASPGRMPPRPEPHPTSSRRTTRAGVTVDRGSNT